MKILIYSVLILSLFASITIYSYFNEDSSALDLARNSSGDELIRSDGGVTRYKIFGQKNIETLILIHSFNGFLESWNPNINSLVDAGYRVVVYDLFGRGLSDRPRTNYDLSLFRGQLGSVVEAIGAKKVYLVGSSFGAVIASDYAMTYPDQIERLVMVGPAGWPQEGGRNWLLNIPVVGELAFHYFGMKILKPKVEDYLLNSSKYPEVLEKWESFARYPGFMRSALSTLKYSPVLDYTAGWEQLGKRNIPMVFIWGKQDVSFPFSNTKKLPKLIPHAKLVGINNAAHWVNIEQAKEVNDAIINFISVNHEGV